MKKPPAIIFLVSLVILFKLLFNVGFDITALQITLDNPINSIQIILPVIIIIGLLARQVWAWYFAAIISCFRILSSLMSIGMSLSQAMLNTVYLLLLHGVILWLLFHQDVSAFFHFKQYSPNQRIKQTITYGVALTVIMVPVAWLTLAFNR